MHAFIGTSGYSYAAWKGPFYPKDLPASQMLAYYSQRFGAVEINNTFYRVPPADLMAIWRDAVPASFLFVIKASRRITHIKRLKDIEEPLDYLLRSTETLGSKLGPLFFQLPPNMKKNAERLATLLALLPPGGQAAFEFRNASWFDGEVFTLLRDHNAALCVADADSDLEVPLEPTADWGYLRLRREVYEPADLARWASRIQEQAWRRVFIFFKHEDAGNAPRLAGQLAALLPEPAARSR